MALLRDPVRRIFPEGHRAYSWGQAQVDQLWEDVVAAGWADNEQRHYFGTLNGPAYTERVIPCG